MYVGYLNSGLKSIPRVYPKLSSGKWSKKFVAHQEVVYFLAEYFRLGPNVHDNSNYDGLDQVVLVNKIILDCDDDVLLT